MKIKQKIGPKFPCFFFLSLFGTVMTNFVNLTLQPNLLSKLDRVNFDSIFPNLDLENGENGQFLVQPLMIDK